MAVPGNLLYIELNSLFRLLSLMGTNIIVVIFFKNVYNLLEELEL